MDTRSSPPAPGRGHLLAGVGAALFGLGLYAAQFRVGWLFVPWYAPGLATLGALLVALAVARRPGVLRLVVLLLVTALAGLEWFFLGALMKLPD